MSETLANVVDENEKSTEKRAKRSTKTNVERSDRFVVFDSKKKKLTKTFERLIAFSFRFDVEEKSC